MKQYREEARKSMEAKCAAYGGTCKAYGGESTSGGGKKKHHASIKKDKPHTKVNVIVAPHVGNRPVPVPVPVREGAAGPVGVAPSRPVVRPAAPVVSPGLASLAGPMKKGGKVHRAHGGKVGHFDAGAGSGEGRLEKTEHQKRRGW